MTEDIAGYKFIVELIVVIGGVVWAIAKIQATTGILNNSILNLKAAIEKLDHAQDALVKKLFDHESRISKLESKDHNRPDECPVEKTHRPDDCPAGN